MTDYLLLAGGLVLLIVGGEMLVRGAVKMAEQFGMSPLLIGLTVVGFGTSAPELVTSVQASLAGSPGIAVGNIVGSNIANILLILGCAAILAPMTVPQSALRRDGVIVLLTAMLFCVVGYFWPLDRMVGGAFLLGLFAYLYYAYLQESGGAVDGHTAAFGKHEAHNELFDDSEGASTSESAAVASVAIWPALLMSIVGLATIVLGGKLLVDGATGIAREAGISETVIGLTIVAVGTSMPELVTSIIAALRRHSDVALGNVLGSNIYNLLGIGGVTGVLSPTEIPPQIVNFDNLVMVGVSALLLVFARTGFRIGRLEGCALLAGYALYLFWLWPK